MCSSVPGIVAVNVEGSVRSLWSNAVSCSSSDKNESSRISSGCCSKDNGIPFTSGFPQTCTVFSGQNLLSMAKCSDLNRFAFIEALVWL